MIYFIEQEPVLGEGESTDLQIDYEKLKVQEKILFFDEVGFEWVPYRSSLSSYFARKKSMNKPLSVANHD